jgi:hypothetical protein
VCTTRDDCVQMQVEPLGSYNSGATLAPKHKMAYKRANYETLSLFRSEMFLYFTVQTLHGHMAKVIK